MDEVSLLRELIAFDTHNPGGYELALAGRLADELRARGPDEVTVVEVPRASSMGAYVFARWGAPRWLINAHFDTVPPSAGWSADPYTARIDGERLIGLGAADTKGAIAAVLTALDDARPTDTAVLFSGDEELSSTCVRAFLQSPHAAGIERALVCEPTGLRAGVRHRGILMFEARLQGPGGHSSRADELPAPLGELSLLAAAYHNLGIKRRHEGPPGFPGLCLNVAKLEGGVAFNVVPDEARLTVSLRPPPGFDVPYLREEILALARAAAPAAELTFAIDNPPFATREPPAFALALADVPLPPLDLGFWTEASLLSQAGIDAVVIGPGDIAQAHAPDEWVSLAELRGARRLFAAAFGRRTNGAG